MEPLVDRKLISEIFSSPALLWEELQSLPNDQLACLSLEELFDPDYFINIVQKVCSENNSQVCNYSMQFFNAFLIKFNHMFMPSISKLFTSRNLALEFLTKSYNYKLKLYQVFQFFFNFIKRTDFEKLQTYNFLLECAILPFLLNTYFKKATPESNDAQDFEWFLFLSKLIQEKIGEKSVVELFFHVLEEENVLKYLNFLQISIDELISNKHSYSVISDLDETPLSRDEEFAKQITFSENSKYFTLKKSDLVFMIKKTVFLFDYFDGNAEGKLSLSNEFLVLLVNVTFVGGYNLSLQNLVINGQNCEQNQTFYFLGQLCELMVRISKTRFSQNNKIKIPEFVTNVLRLVCNLVHANESSQNFILDHQYLPFFLAQTNRDDLNLHSKEVVIVFVRYMTESNQKARDMIASLTVEDFIKENANFVKKFDF